MSVKTILFLVAFTAVCGGAMYTPLTAVVGYVLHYQITPEGPCWAAPIASWWIRYSLVLGAAAVGGRADAQLDEPIPAQPTRCEKMAPNHLALFYLVLGIIMYPYAGLSGRALSQRRRPQRLVLGHKSRVAL